MKINIHNDQVNFITGIQGWFNTRKATDIPQRLKKNIVIKSIKRENPIFICDENNLQSRSTEEANLTENI